MSGFYELLNSIASALNKINSTNLFIGTVGQDIVDTANISTTISLFEDLYNAVAAAGLCLVAVFFLMNWIEAMTYNEANMEKFISLLLKLLLAMFFINEGFNLLKYIVEFGDQLVVTYIGKINTASFETGNVLIEDLDIFAIISRLLTYLPVYLVIFAVQLCSKFIVYTRFFEVNIHLAAAPIAFANMFEEKRRNVGMKYFKKFIALCLQGIIIAVIVIAGSEVLCNPAVLTQMFATVGTVFGAGASMVGGASLGLASIATMSAAGLIIELIKCSVIGFTIISLMFKSRSIANDIVGV